MKQFNVTGMSCAACSARVENAVKKVDGVESCSVNLLTNSMTVEGDASTDSIISAVKKAGYGASERQNEAKNVENDLFDSSEEARLKLRLIASLVFLTSLMYISMGHVMWGWYLPEGFAKNPLAIAISQMLLAIAVMIINQKFFINGIKSLIKGSPNMDTLVALGSGASFVYSVCILFVMTGADNKAHYLHELYFESAAMILALITVGKMLEAHAKGKTTDALRSLMALSPKKATVVRGGKELVIEAKDVLKGDIFVVRPGESIPVDGRVIEGESAVDESSLTGESVPNDKTVGDSVFASCINKSGFIKCEATRVGDDTTFSQIVKMVSDASSSKAPIAKIADRVSGIFVPAVITIAVITTVIWLIATGGSIGYSLERGISVLVISCPCALGLATPVAIMVGSGMGAKNGILFKTAESLEQTGRINIVVLDKTGTVTKGKPQVTDVIPIGISEGELMDIAYSAEIKSEHPLSAAIVEKGEKMNAIRFETNEFAALPGSGIFARIGEDNIYGGSLKLAESKCDISSADRELARKLANDGKTPMFFIKNNTLVGIIAVSDEIKEDSERAVKELHDLGIYVVMLTGDNERTASAIGKKVGVDKIIANVMPADKERHIKELKKHGKVAMVGDGINDAPALKSADIGIAVGQATDVAIDSADVVLMKSSLCDVSGAIRLSRATLRNIKQNLFWAFFYNMIGIPLAAGALIPILGWRLKPMFGAAAMSLSSFCVVTNALRLNFFNIRNTKKFLNKRNIIIERKEKNNMSEKVFKVKGMMCPHCENAVKTRLEQIEGVKEAIADHKAEEVRLVLERDVNDEVIVSAITEKGYEVIV
ncbi:MAG: heavy metal translocating P-type ATPase [Clostridia bacterium]|nr:heavy metal translocating P-type ATPase [Clostridia bacterium]